MRTSKLVLALVLALLVAFGVVGTAAMAIPTDTTALRNAVSVERIMKHERAFQKIADSNGGTRVTGTQGYDASADYVAGKLKAAGYNVTVQEFTHPFFQVRTRYYLLANRPDGQVVRRGHRLQYRCLLRSTADSGNLVDAPVVPTNDIIMPPTPTPSSSSGCEAGDFPTPSATEDQVALIQRGTCSFRLKADNAQAAGYDAAIIFNEGQPLRDASSSSAAGSAGRGSTSQYLLPASPSARNFTTTMYPARRSASRRTPSRRSAPRATLSPTIRAGAPTAPSWWVHTSTPSQTGRA